MRRLSPTQTDLLAWMAAAEARVLVRYAGGFWIPAGVRNDVWPTYPQGFPTRSVGTQTVLALAKAGYLEPYRRQDPKNQHSFFVEYILTEAGQQWTAVDKQLIDRVHVIGCVCAECSTATERDKQDLREVRRVE